MKKILVPTDFSDWASNAADYAIQLASQMDGEVHFIHIMSIPVDWTTLDNNAKMYPDVTKKVNQKHNMLHELIALAESKGVKASCYLHYNESYKYLIKYAEDNNFDLIVMGSHGADSLRDVFVGTNTQRVVRFSKVPVICVKKRVRKMKKIALFSDFSPEADFLEDYIKEMISTISAELNLVYINTPMGFLDSNTIQNRIKKFKQSSEIEAESFIQDDYTFQSGMENFCKYHNADMILMATHFRTGLDRAIAGSLTENIIIKVDIPVMSIPLPEMVYEE